MNQNFSGYLKLFSESENQKYLLKVPGDSKKNPRE